MSASLVGSEMCIRDRSSTASGALAGWPPSGPGSMDGKSPRCSPVSMGACLLYTSDAADDM
eukprot:5029585-Alexandrium_andersonii.AAC.1